MELLKLTANNYFSTEANTQYMSASQYKMFVDCEEMALAYVQGLYKPKNTTALLVGSYVDSYFTEDLERFIAENPEIVSSKGQTKGELKTEFKQANYIIDRIKKDEMFIRYLSGEKQVIKTGLIAGVPFKIKIDSYFPKKAIVDLKIIKDFKAQWKFGQRLNFIEYWMYDHQLSIYQEVESQNSMFKLPTYIAAATKEEEPDLSIIQIPNDRLDWCLDEIKTNVLRYDAIKKSQIIPTRCGICDWCKRTKVLKNVITYDPTKADIFEGVET